MVQSFYNKRVLVFKCLLYSHALKLSPMEKNFNVQLMEILLAEIIKLEEYIFVTKLVVV